ncbi:uncharacterized protein A4U43_C02F1610 [Asparagus officinalis]|uniref:Uncharacterized protein n=1 Tax=Asparagus officinalis TaxID=4686 RepID=A0A5P1FGV3_ASPOF|nr:uncharacterized protein A4U43_C02F1610 [Asparagus officinalis]
MHVHHTLSQSYPKTHQPQTNPHHDSSSSSYQCYHHGGRSPSPTTPFPPPLPPLLRLRSPACTLVAAAPLLPHPLRRHLKFRRFAYVTSFLIVSDATSGTPERAPSRLYGTVLGLLRRWRTFHVMQPQNMSAPRGHRVAISSYRWPCRTRRADREEGGRSGRS